MYIFFLCFHFTVARGNHQNLHRKIITLSRRIFSASTALKLSEEKSHTVCCGSTALNINISILYIHIYIYPHMSMYVYIYIYIYIQPFAQHTFLMIQIICIAFMEVPHTEATSSSVTCSWLGNASPKHMSSGRCLKTIQKWREIMVGSSCLRGTRKHKLTWIIHQYIYIILCLL